jgi:DHA1 family bicyclomycin/chloramphenicol resistance-like MFS transporter
MRLRPESFLFTVFLSALGGLTPLSIDMGLPALASLGHSLHVSPAAAGLTLSFFLAGFALGPLLLGPLSDRFGRRPVLLGGTLVFVLASAGCAGSHVLPWLLFWRMLSGIGAGASATLSLAIVRDLFDGIAARVKLSYVGTVGTLAPMIAPTLGALILGLAGWRAIYGTLAVLGSILLGVVALFFRESLAEPNLTALQPGRMAANYGWFLSRPVCLGYALTAALNFGALFSYVSSSPLVMMGVLGVSPAFYGWTFAATALGLMAGAFLNGKLSARAVPSSTLLTLSLSTSAAASLAILGVAHSPWAAVGTLLPLLVLNAVASGLVTPNATQGALHPVPEIAGVAAAIIGSSRMLTGALASVAVALIFDGRTAHAMGLMMSLFSLGALAAYFGVVRPAERRQTRLAFTRDQTDGVGNRELP